MTILFDSYIPIISTLRINLFCFTPLLTFLIFSCTENVDSCSFEHWEGQWVGNDNCLNDFDDSFEYEVKLTNEFIEKVESSSVPCKVLLHEETRIDDSPISGGVTLRHELELSKDTLFYIFSFLPRHTDIVAESICEIPMTKID